MSVSLWDYSPEKCDGDYCPGDCDLCDKETSDDETEMINYINADELKIEIKNALEGWVSPVELIYEDAKNIFLEQTDEHIMVRCEAALGVKVDRDELIKAMSYDREQYRKGFENGYKNGYKKRDDEIVRCKDCKWWVEGPENYEGIPQNKCHYFADDDSYNILPDDFCSRAERKETDE